MTDKPVGQCLFPGCPFTQTRDSDHCTGHTKQFGKTRVDKPQKEVKEEKPKAELKKKKGPRKRSKKRVKDMRIYREKLKEFFDNPENKICAIQRLTLTDDQKEIFAGCTKVATEYHHPSGRIGDNLMPNKNGVGLCHHCHEHIEKQPLLAKELGLSKSRLAKA